MPKKPKSTYIPTDEEREQDQIEREAKALKLLGFNPFAIGRHLEKWQKGCAWHGMPELKKKLKKAGFNLPLLIAHLEAMTARLKASK